MKLDWRVDQPASPSLTSLMQLAADRAAEAEGIMLPCFVSVRLCGEEEIRELNRDYRNLDRATDVLSFPAVSWPEGVTAGKGERLLRRAYDAEADACFLGDIVISVPRIYEQAEAYGHSPEREAAYLLVHGLCHLMGYDHIREEDRICMRAQEENILESVGMQREGVGTPSDETLLALARDAMTRSYSPYSHFPVGAALHCTDGRIFQGCNIENASFGVTNCAERTALFKAVSEGAREFDVIAIACEDTKPAWPCGACRQALSEFAPDIRVLVTWKGGASEELTLSRLLPCQFDLKKEESGK